jgi:hypothetical protein
VSFWEAVHAEQGVITPRQDVEVTLPAAEHPTNAAPDNDKITVTHGIDVVTV